MLQEIVVRDRPYLNRKLIHSETLSNIRPLKAGNSSAGPSPGGGASFSVNFAYFTREEKEKRKLITVLADLKQVKVYVDIVNDEAFREEVMEKYAIPETKFYDLLALFNQRNSELMHSGNAELILSSLMFYFRNAAGK